MRLWAAACAAFFACVAHGERILLVPLDSRPAAGHFAQMIGSMADVEIVEPPKELLGRFTEPGDSEAVIAWLQSQDYSDVTAVIVSTDMIAYGGLIASRVPDVSYELALKRLKAVADIRKTCPHVRFYGYSAIMRLHPTATKATAAWRMQLGRYAEIKERYRQTKSSTYAKSLRNLEAKIPPIEVQRYEKTRTRNHEIQQALLRLTRYGAWDYLILGQDDAQPYGPHIPETQKLRTTVKQLYIGGKVYFCEGIDQHANVLVSRALLRARDWVPRVRVVYSDELGKKKIAAYESKDIQTSLSDQIFASGARPVLANQAYDYTLYLNTPERRDSTFRSFVQSLTAEIDMGFPVAVADIDLAKDGTADPELFDALWENNRIMKLLAYAGWNTAGNTMGTSIPAANVYLLSRKEAKDPLGRELALREFLLHRLVNDFAYHKYTRPEAYKMIDSTPNASREETYGYAFSEVNNFVQRDLAKRLQETFNQQFLGKRFFAGSGQYEVVGLEDVNIYLPWPRAYEVRLEFKLQARDVSAPAGTTGK